ncbi:MAG TPA: AAA family ATPase [Blastocatellia bacterium]|nr:AAA family ATPase [Blastocatellia bacterium]
MIFSNYLMQALQQQISGQEYAVTALTRAVTLALAGMFYKNRPLAVLLFVGPTGSGKTQAAQALARVLLGDERRMIYVDCQQLCQDADQLTNLRQQLLMGYWRSQTVPPPERPAFSVLVFEDVDKAPAAFRDHLVVAIDRGEIFTPGHYFSLRNTFIILTSTLSKKKADQIIGRTIGFFRDGEADVDMPRQHIVALEEMDNMLGSHLVSHIDEIIIFERLSEQNIVKLLDRHLAEIERFLACYSIGFLIDQDAKAFLLRGGLEDLTHGMRQINRTVRNYLEFPLADLMLSRRLVPGTTVMVKYEPPRRFLDFQILIPRLAPPEWPAPESRLLER